MVFIQTTAGSQIRTGDALFHGQLPNLKPPNLHMILRRSEGKPSRCVRMGIVVFKKTSAIAVECNQFSTGNRLDCLRCVRGEQICWDIEIMFRQQRPI